MKKILGIIVLGLLWAGSANAADLCFKKLNDYQVHIYKYGPKTGWKKRCGGTDITKTYQLYIGNDKKFYDYYKSWTGIIGSSSREQEKDLEVLKVNMFRLSANNPDPKFQKFVKSVLGYNFKNHPVRKSTDKQILSYSQIPVMQIDTQIAKKTPEPKKEIVKKVNSKEPYFCLEKNIHKDDEYYLMPHHSPVIKTAKCDFTVYKSKHPSSYNFLKGSGMRGAYGASGVWKISGYDLYHSTKAENLFKRNNVTKEMTWNSSSKKQIAKKKPDPVDNNNEINKSLWRFNQDKYVLFLNDKCYVHLGGYDNYYTNNANPTDYDREYFKVTEKFRTNTWVSKCSFENRKDFIKLDLDIFYPGGRTSTAHGMKNLKSKWVKQDYYLIISKNKAIGSYSEKGINGLEKIRNNKLPPNIRGQKVSLDPSFKANLDRVTISKTQVAKKTPKPEKKFELFKKSEKKPDKQVAKQKEFKLEEKDLDKDPPIITIAQSITVNNADYEIKGEVKDKSKKIFVLVDGQPVDVKRGKFKIKRFSPIDEKVEIVAIDKWNNRSKKTVSVKVDIKSIDVAEQLEKLDPRKIKGKRNSNAVALIIGVEKYTNAPEANYANLDAKFFAEYAKKAFGVKSSNLKLLIDQDASLVKTLSTLSKWLPTKMMEGETDLIIFFAGHGLASPNGEKLYLLAQDSDTELLDRTALSRDELFKEILKYKPKSVTMFLDTCYSGVSRDEKTLLASARPIRISVKETNEVPENFTIFSASQLDQISSSIKEAKHGIFSYYLMKGLEGKADLNKDRSLTNKELLTFMKSKVNAKAVELDRQQIPVLTGNPEKIILIY
tara:strand:- start:96 stop:2579 length:2484 start_codon:yes stop_codon:yes gene_type:complete